MALTFDVELRADCDAVPIALRELTVRRIPASFACIGRWIDEYPEAHRAIVGGGFEALNHTDTHPPHDELGTQRGFRDLPAQAVALEVDAAARKLRGIGSTSAGFRTPHFASQHTEQTYGVLAAAGIRYSSSTVANLHRGGGAPWRHESGVTEIPLLPCPRHPADLLDSWHCTTAPDAAHADDLVAVYVEALSLVERSGAFGCVYWDPRVVLLPGYAAVLDEIVRFGTTGRLLTLSEAAGI